MAMYPYHICIIIYDILLYWCCEILKQESVSIKLYWQHLGTFDDISAWRSCVN